MPDAAANVVAVGASAGGVEALTALASGLPEGLDAAVAVVLHLHPTAESRLARILDRAGPLPASKAEDGDELLPGRIYVAPPDHHLLVRPGRCSVVRGAHENGVRPSIDVLFRSAASAFGPRAIAVVLSGARDDGVAGASAVGRHGGCVIVQDPEEAVFPSMPAETVARDHPDQVLPLARVADAVAGAVSRLSKEVGVSDNGADEMHLETEYATLDADILERDGPPGDVSPFSCPACGGVLWQVEDGELLRFRCRVGHAFSAEGALDAEGEEIETALWTALRALQERAHLSTRIAGRMERTGAERSRKRFEDLAREAHEQADLIRRVLVGRDAGRD